MAVSRSAADVSAGDLIAATAEARRRLCVVVRRSAKRCDGAMIDVRHPVAIIAIVAGWISGGAERPHFAQKRLVASILRPVARVIAKIMIVACGGEIDSASHAADRKRRRAATV
jgi:hypothetical protein